MLSISQRIGVSLLCSSSWEVCRFVGIFFNLLLTYEPLFFFLNCLKAKHLTEAAKGGPIEPFKALFAPKCYVILQSEDGGELEFSLGDDPDCSMSWEQFAEASFKDLEEQKYDCTTTNCLGVLGNRMILESRPIKYGRRIVHDSNIVS